MKTFLIGYLCGVGTIAVPALVYLVRWFLRQRQGV